ncbi:MAG: Mth938-like domain-containing protein [Hyphomicrobiales bacterium]|nr:Mth938-like domain-containing protein [Hyphomicrobiales bacterium]MDE2114845.1 Mth938-like domain-containing protein [Hyphomicrobiales bacterium]
MDRAAGDGFLPGQHAIDAYGNGGFRFGDMSHKGSILALPTGVHEIAQGGLDAIAEAVLTLLKTQPRGSIEILLIGAGAQFAPLPKAFAFALQEARISFEVMGTGAAARTYNILLGERRRVAAVLIAVA